MSTASGLSTEDLASNLFGAKSGGGLEAFFAPQNIAVIGATEKAGSIGRTLVRNLISSPFGDLRMKPRRLQPCPTASSQRPRASLDRAGCHAR